MQVRLAFVAVGVAALTASGLAQVPTDRPAFEVVSIKPGDSTAGGGGLQFQAGGRVVGSNMRVLDLIQTAYRTDRPLLGQQVVGLPEWATTLRYNLSAKISTDAPTDAAAAFAHVRDYLRSLLEDRFALQAHMEKRDASVYALRVPAGGHRLRPTTIDCSKPGAGCGIRFGAGRVTGQMNVGDLVGSLSGAAGRIVIDETHVNGRFDIDLQWNASGDPSDEHPSIFAAVQEQLGLKLESSRAPVDVLVVDHVEHPTED
jgi:uncharacterized protein (TIGR03435 family)